MQEAIQSLSVLIPPLLVAVILHEVAHGFVANRLGDPTAARMGRLTLNPLPHIDPIGSVLLPLLLYLAKAPFLFGWAKPVPVNYLNLRRPKRDMVLVALAGPGTNVVLALICAGVLHLLAGLELPSGGIAARLADTTLTPVALMARNGVLINVMLAVFNLLPILPLDGGRVLAGFLPRASALAFARLEPYGMFIVMALLMTDVFDRMLGPVVRLVFRALL